MVNNPTPSNVSSTTSDSLSAADSALNPGMQSTPKQSTCSHKAVVLSIAGSDSSAGAGIQADIKACAAMGAYAVTAVTAVTAQGAGLVRGVFAMPASLVHDQLAAVTSTFTVGAVKLGMLANIAIAEVVADYLADSNGPVIIDPVLKASTGDALSVNSADDQTALLDYYRQHLIPLASLITPNLHEAAQLLQEPMATTHADYERQALKLLELGCAAVLLKGGHSQDERLCSDYLAFCDPSTGQPSVKAFTAARLNTRHGHGTGCTLASAIAAGLVQGLTLLQAVNAAKNYLHGALAAAQNLDLVPAHGPLHHFNAYW